MSKIAAPTVLILAAGSLEPALRELASGLDRAVAFTFGPSGLLRGRIEAGESAHLFVSADLAHPAALVAAGRGDRVWPFVGNALCVLARPEAVDGHADVLDLMLDPGLRLGMSMPGADPSADYTLAMFAAAERLRPGAGTVLTNKARRLTGTPNHATAPGRLNVYAWLLAINRADLFVTYRTSALAALRDNPALRLFELPESLAVPVCYGLTVLDPAAEPVARYLVSEPAAATLARHGFLPPEGTACAFSF